MANRVSYLNSENTFWQDIDLKNVERDFFTEGIVDFNEDAPSPSAVGSDLQVLAQDTPDKTIKVKIGVAYFQATRIDDTDGDGIADALILRFHNLAEQSIVIPDNVSGSDKTFEVCCSIPAGNMDATSINATASNIGELIVQEEGTGLDNKLLLATVTVEDSFTEVTQVKITDHRLRVALKAVPKGLTATVSEINLALDGILASSLDLNILENTTVTKDEFNRALAGTLVTAAELNLLNAVAGLTKADLQKLANIDATADEIDQALDGISPEVSAANLNIIMGGGFTNLHKHATDPSQSGITDSPAYFYLPSGQPEAVTEKGVMTRFSYQEDAEELASQNIEVVNDDFQGYESYYKEICNFENDAGESYIGGSFDLVEYKEGVQARKRQLSLDSTGTLLVEFSTAKDISAFAGSDTIEFWLFVTDLPNNDMATVQIGSTTPSSNYFQNDFFSQITGSGWNKIKIPMSAFSSIGTPDWSDLVRLRFEFSTNTNGSCDFTVDSLRVISSDNTTGAFWSNTDGEWSMHDVTGLKRYVKTDEVSGDKDSVLSLGNQSRSYENGIFTARIRRLQGATNTGIKWRYTSPTSCYTAYFTATDLVLGKINGTFTQIQAISFPFVNGVDYWIKVQFNNDQIIVSTSTDGLTFNDQITVTDSDISGAGQIALFDDGNISAFDKTVFEQTSITYERDTADNLLRIEENTGNGDKFDGFNSFFKKIATFELSENTMVGGVADLVNFKTGLQGWKVSASAEVAKDSVLDLNLNTFEDGINSTNTDLITLWVFIEGELPTSLNIALSEVAGSKEATTQINSGLSLGWNFISLAKSVFTISGGFDWSKVIEFSFYYTHSNSTPNITLDSVQMIKSTGVLASKYDVSGGQWHIEKDIDESEKYLVQTDESAGEKFLILKTDGTSNKFANFNLRARFMARRGNAFALIFKYQDSNNFLRLQCKDGRISFVKRVTGVDTILGEEMAFTPTSDAFFSLKVVCDDNNFKYYYSDDGIIWVLISEVSVSDFTDGQVGIFDEDTMIRVDELFIFEHNQGGDTFYEVFYDGDGNVSSIIKKPIISI